MNTSQYILMLLREHNFNHNLQKPQPRIYWSYKQGNTTVEFGNTPFILGDSQYLQCQYGPQYYKSKPAKENNCVCKAHVKLDALHMLSSNTTLHSQSMLYTPMILRERANTTLDS